MKQAAFVARHETDWGVFEQWLAAQGSRSGRAASESILAAVEVPARYRRICHHLSLSRRRHYSPRLQQRLNQLALRGHRHLYRSRPSLLRQFGRFFALTFPAAFRRHWRFVAVSAALFYGPLFALLIASTLDPTLAFSVIDPATAAKTIASFDPENQVLGEFRDADADFYMFAYYVLNNIGIGLRTYGLGLTLGLGSVAILLFNGLYIGAVFGLVADAGNGTMLWQFVAGHSSLELTAIVIAGGAGLMLGNSFWAPGSLTRVDSLRAAALQSVPLIVGASAMLFGAAFIEAFWSSIPATDPTFKYAVGAALWTLVSLYFLLLGRGHEA